MIRGIIYLTGLITLAVIGLVMAVAFQVHRWPWVDYIRQGREELVRLLDADSPRESGGNSPKARRVVIELPEGFGLPELPRRETREYGEDREPAPTASRHTVASGETLYSIARRYYGNGESWPLIASANGIRRPADLRVGSVLMIPHEAHPHGPQAWVPDLRIGFTPAGKR